PLLPAAGVQREQVFPTTGVLCNPRDAQGRNSTPTSRELHACLQHLRATLDLLQPHLVVTLGCVALEATRLIAPHLLQVARDVGRPCCGTGACWYLSITRVHERVSIDRSQSSGKIVAVWGCWCGD